MAELEYTINDLATALDGLDSYDPALTKRALRFLVDQGEIEALPKILPLIQHPSPAIRFVAKRAVAELRALPPERQRIRPQFHTPVETLPVSHSVPAAPLEAEQEKIAVGGAAFEESSMDPRLQKLLDAKPRRRTRPPRAGGVPMRWFHLEL